MRVYCNSQQRGRVTAPELEQFIVVNVQLTGVTLGNGAYGSVEEVEIPGARVAAKKLHTQLINLGSPQQVLVYKDFVLLISTVINIIAIGSQMGD